ncbi:tetratricopeptide repeat protein [Paenibacillus pinihumi]|uniref:tetratricopeptide repeat protein n=1 Tax=Paenibacillus pinihumi TaxID=669462 RepID=UPI0004071150|nr:tetratricopeptide repeat protein [Paenibacillus pinihumi]
MGKFLLFPLLWWLFGNPFVAIIVLLIIAYFIDRRFIGLTPSLVRPFKRRSRIAKLRQQLLLNPGDVTAKQELARLYIEKKNYREARKWLESIGDVMEHSAEFWDDLGTTYIHTGDAARGEEAILKGISINPRVKYGQPYLRLAHLHSNGDPGKALDYLETFRHIHSSSCEAYYRLGTIYEQLGRSREAAEAYREAVNIYRSLPKYKKRQERKWVIRCLLKKRK